MCVCVRERERGGEEGAEGHYDVLVDCLLVSRAKKAQKCDLQCTCTYSIYMIHVSEVSKHKQIGLTMVSVCTIGNTS